MKGTVTRQASSLVAASAQRKTALPMPGAHTKNGGKPPLFLGWPPAAITPRSLLGETVRCGDAEVGGLAGSYGAGHLHERATKDRQATIDFRVAVCPSQPPSVDVHPTAGKPAGVDVLGSELGFQRLSSAEAQHADFTAEVHALARNARRDHEATGILLGFFLVVYEQLTTGFDAGLVLRSTVSAHFRVSRREKIRRTADGISSHPLANSVEYRIFHGCGARVVDTHSVTTGRHGEHPFRSGRNFGIGDVFIDHMLDRQR